MVNNRNMANIQNIKSASMTNLKGSPARNTEEKISNSLSLRLSPERKYAPIEVDINDNFNNIHFIEKNNNNYNVPKLNTGIIFNKEQINNNSKNYIDSNNNNLPSSPSSNNEERISNSLSLRLSPERKYGPYEVEVDDCNKCNNFPCTCNNLKLNNKIINRNNNIEYTNNNFWKEGDIKNDEIKQLNYFLKTLMDGEKEIELYKVDLALKRDFNCEDIFRIFEYNGAGYITSEDLKYGLDLLDIKTNEYIINLLMNRFDLMKRGQINYADFFDMIVPFQRSYRNLVEAKIPLSDNPKNILSILNKNTICSLKVLFVCIIEFEFRINDIRKKLSNLKGKLMELFKLFDIDNFGYFDYSKLINYLQKNKINYKQLNADLLFIRLDKNRNGKIDFKEFKNEILGL
jgi:Ca2+-binding EF-hand superfamily protein